MSLTPARRTSSRGLVVLPTFNEALNLSVLVPRILAEGEHVDVLVVDDGSPDGTGALADDLTKQFPERVRVLHRTSKSGRGGAVMAGFRTGLSDERYSWFAEMDADQSHDAAELPQMWRAIEDADVVVGTRYMPEGRIQGWPLRRRVWSRTSNIIIRIVLGVPLSDLTNGYRLYSRRAVELLVGADLRETGFITLLEWAFTLHRAGLRFRQVPSVFVNRRLGHSNMSAAEAIGALRALARMRIRVPQRR